MLDPPDRPKEQGVAVLSTTHQAPKLARLLTRNRATRALVAVAATVALLQLALSLHPHVAPGREQLPTLSWLPSDVKNAPRRRPEVLPIPPVDVSGRFPPAGAVEEQRPTDAVVQTLVLGDAPAAEVPPFDRGLNMSSFAVSQIPLELKRGHLSSLPRVPVVVWPLVELGLTTAESQSILKDGVEQSRWLELATDAFHFDPNVVWVGDIGYEYDYNVSCTNFNDLILEAQQKRATLKLPLQWPVFIVNFGDVPTFQKCAQVEESIGPNMVQYATRSIVDERVWSNATGWIVPGFRINMTFMGSLFRHTPLVVRTDTIVVLDHVLQERRLRLSSPLETLERSYDLAHFWPNIVTEADKVGISAIEAKLRTRVSRILSRMASNDTYTVHGRRLHVHVGLAGDALAAGRRSVAKAYIDRMLDSKIVVVTQRDKWEDHYRLFEGLVSGAMVMCDRMLSLPAGLRNGTHLIEFTSERDLVQKALYYLEHDDERRAIAADGRRLAMARHRSWHRMEEIIFGEPLTVCHESLGSSCPYIVHGNETSLTALRVAQP